MLCYINNYFQNEFHIDYVLFAILIQQSEPSLGSYMLDCFVCHENLRLVETKYMTKELDLRKIHAITVNNKLFS